MIKRVRNLLFFLATSLFLVLSSSRLMALSEAPNTNLWITNGPVYAIVKVGNIIYIGGIFSYVGPETGVGGVVRSNLAALDATTGAATDWNPDVNGPVFDFAVNGSTIFVAGDFSSIGGTPRHALAAIDATTGLPTSWTCNVYSSGVLKTLLLNGSMLYVGGNF